MKVFFTLLLLITFSHTLQANPVASYQSNVTVDYYDEEFYKDYYGEEYYEGNYGVEVEDGCECEDEIFETNCKCGVTGELQQPPCLNQIDNTVFGDTQQTPALQVCRTEGGKCEDFAEDGFVCVPSFNCNGTIITDGESLIDVRGNLDPIPGECIDPEATLDSTDRKCQKEGHVCCLNPDFSKKPKPLCVEEPHYNECGRTLESGLKISGGDFDKNKFAQPGEFSHMCIIYKVENKDRIYVGGASLIARNKLLTVAHKFWLTKKGQKDVNDFNHPEKFIVRCGEHNVRNEADLLPHQETPVKKIHIHPDYVPRKVKNNLAIIETVENFVYQKHVGRVCLPGVDSSVYEGKTECWSSGWGADTYSSSDNTKYSDTLKKIKMPVVDLGTCQSKLRQHERLRSRKKTFKVHKSWLCVGGEPGIDTCSGDGGSPHVCKEDNGKFVQVGAVNWGLGCGEAVPSIYSNVPDSMCWIDYIMSCVSQSNVDVDISSSDYNYDIRVTDRTVKSVNNLSLSDCRKWNKDHQITLDEYECKVNYNAQEQFDERKV